MEVVFGLDTLVQKGVAPGVVDIMPFVPPPPPAASTTPSISNVGSKVTFISPQFAFEQETFKIGRAHV
jgi:hypothetical protein